MRKPKYKEEQNRRAMTGETERGRNVAEGKETWRWRQTEEEKEEGRDWESEKNQDVTCMWTRASQGMDSFCTNNRY